MSNLTILTIGRRVASRGNPGRNVDRSAIEELLQRRGTNKTALAKALRIHNSGVSSILSGARAVKSDELAKMAEFLGVSRDRLLRLLGVALTPAQHMLLIGAHIEGDKVIVWTPDEISDRQEEAPGFDGYTGTVARIDTNDMAPRYAAGDLIYFRLDAGLADIDSLIGRDAVVELDDGAIYLKTVHRGSQPDLFVLTSHDPKVPPLVNVPLRAIAKIDWHRP